MPREDLRATTRRTRNKGKSDAMTHLIVKLKRMTQQRKKRGKEKTAHKGQKSIKVKLV
jgi:hypothetical protein